jgi:hypothetical protein
MIRRLNDHSERAKARIGALLDEALMLTDEIGDLATGAHIAQALHMLDPTRYIVLPPRELKQ